MVGGKKKKPNLGLAVVVNDYCVFLKAELQEILPNPCASGQDTTVRVSPGELLPLPRTCLSPALWESAGGRSPVPAQQVCTAQR